MHPAERPISRRRLLQGAAAGAGLSLMGGLGGVKGLGGIGGLGSAGALDRRTHRWADVLAPGTRPDPTKPEGVDLLPQVEHIVIYMQENHSYDNYFGMLGRGEGFTRNAAGQPTNTNPDANGNPVTVTHAPSTCQTGTRISQSWNASHTQFDGGRNDGFVRSTDATAMRYFDGSDLPFYYGLAETFVVCDRWFGSCLGQTFPNRRYLQAGTSVGIVSTNIQEVLATPSAPNGVIWERFDAHGISWTDYAFDLADILLFPDYGIPRQATNVKPYQQFIDDCAAGALPQVSIISPGNATYTEENPHDITLGEAYSAAIVNAVLHSPNWSNTVLFFLYDEHGGYYDHVPPPAAIAPDSIAPRVTSPPDAVGGFDQYGFRVPAVIVSPFTKPNYVSSVVHDHTSILKFIETKFNLGALTYRDANADNLFDAFDFAGPPAFAEPPELPLPRLRAGGTACEDVPLPSTEPTPTTTTTTTTTTTNPGTTTAPGATTTSTPGSSAVAPTSDTTSVPAGAGAGSTGASGAAGSTGASGATGSGTAGAGTGSGTAAGTGATLPRTGAPIGPLAAAGGLATLAGIAAVAAERSRRAQPTPVGASVRQADVAPTDRAGSNHQAERDDRTEPDDGADRDDRSDR